MKILQFLGTAPHGVQTWMPRQRVLYRIVPFTFSHLFTQLALCRRHPGETEWYSGTYQTTQLSYTIRWYLDGRLWRDSFLSCTGTPLDKPERLQYSIWYSPPDRRCGWSTPSWGGGRWRWRGCCCTGTSAASCRAGSSSSAADASSPWR